MFGALAGKLLVEGRRPILLNHCVPANHRVSCQAGEGGLPIQKYIENFKKEFTSNLPILYLLNSRNYFKSAFTILSSILFS